MTCLVTCCSSPMLPWAQEVPRGNHSCDEHVVGSAYCTVSSGSHRDRTVHSCQRWQEHAPPSPLGGARSALPGCSLHRTSSPGSGAHSNHGCAAACLQGACGRTYTAPLACTAQRREEKKGVTSHVTNGTHVGTNTHHRIPIPDSFTPSWAGQGR